MARLKFLGFDLQGNGVPCGTGGAIQYVACDPGVQFCGRSSDTALFDSTSGSGYVSITGGYKGGSAVGGSFFRNVPLTSEPFGVNTAESVTLLHSSIGNVSEIWCTFEVLFSGSYSAFVNGSYPSTWARSENRWQIFKFGDLRLQLLSVIGTATLGRHDVTFRAYNGATILGDITVPGVNSISVAWVPIHVRLRAKLAGSGAGAFELLIGGVSASFTGLDTVATTPLDQVERLWFSGGGMQNPVGSPPIIDSYLGGIDNILIDDAAWPSGRPVVAVVSSGFSDTSITGWAATAGGTISNAVLSVDSNRARGTGGGSRAILDIPAPTMTTWNSNLLGYQIVPGLLSSLDNVNIKRLKSGVLFGGVDRFGTVTANITPPFSPDRLQNCGTDTIFYNGGTTDFLKANVASTDVVLEVT